MLKILHLTNHLTVKYFPAIAKFDSYVLQYLTFYQQQSLGIYIVNLLVSRTLTLIGEAENYVSDFVYFSDLWINYCYFMTIILITTRLWFGDKKV